MNKNKYAQDYCDNLISAGDDIWNEKSPQPKISKEQLLKYANDGIIKANNLIKSQSNIKATEILLDTIQSIAYNVVANNSLYNITLDNEEIKSKIVGKNGKILTYFEDKFGVDIIMNESLKVSISCQNHVRREIAALALKRIIKGGHADFEYVDRIKKEETEEFDRICTEIGKDVIENKLKFFDVNHSIYRIVGQMQYRKSYGQNILEHMVECAQICALLARQFGYDEYIARKTGFFHDIGKSTDYNAEHDHVANGIEIAKKYNLGNDVIEVIRGHHEHTKTENTYLKFAKIADTISASRPGARHGQNEDFKTKSKEINLLKEKFHEINKIIINKSGRELVIVLNCTDETDLETLEFNINNTICANDKLNKFPINITIIHNIAE